MGQAGMQLEGSRFGTCPRDPAIFVSARARPQISLNRRLPRTSQRVLGLWAAKGRMIYERNGGQNIACGNSREPPV